MTEDEKELVKVAAEAAFRPFAELTQKLFGGACEQIGGYWEDGLRFRRQIRQLSLLKNLSAAIEEAGFSPRAIPDVIWIPAVEEASRVDDETLQDTWANLLANAADPRQESMNPAFSAILRELTSREVRFLQELFNEVNGVIHRRLDLQGLMNVYLRSTERYGGQPDNSEFYLILEILERNRILSEHLTRESVAPIRPKPGILAGDTSGLQDLQGYNKFTLLGYAFVQACQKPKAS